MGYVKKFSAFTKKEEEAKIIKEQGQTGDVYTVPEQFKAEHDAITQKKTQVVQLEQQLAAEKANLDKMSVDLQTKMAAQQNAAAQQVAADKQKTPMNNNFNNGQNQA